MQRLILIFFIASELCYYLLIAQTGIVEYFSSNIFYLDFSYKNESRKDKIKNERKLKRK